MNQADELFNSDRDRLRGLAYRMVGSISDAEDIVQDAWLRWQSCDKTTVENPRHYITRIVSNLSLDRLRANKKHRDTYIGSWLPEPTLESFPAPESANPEHELAVADEVTVAFLLTLETLSPAERAAFILHDVFTYEFSEVSDILDRSDASCRQLASRARKALKDGKPRYTTSLKEATTLAEAFQRAIEEGDLAGLTALLSKNTTFVSDGGGKVAAVPGPVIGADKVATMILGFAKLYRHKSNVSSTFTKISGLPGFILWDGSVPMQTLSLEINRESLIETIYVVRNPEKLTHIEQGFQQSDNLN